MAAENLLKEIKKLKNNATYGKKRHFNASDRKQNWHIWLVFPVLLLNIFLSSRFFVELKDGLWIYVPSLIALISAILIGSSEFFKFGKKATEHSAIGNRYLYFIRECSEALALQKDGLITEEELKRNYQDLNRKITEIDAAANALPTTNNDYNKARAGVLDGEEEHTEKELS